jgi:septum site-determining protein MinC
MEAATQELDSVIADAKPAALLRGTARGLEVVVDATADSDAITAAMVMWLDKAPGFFKGSDVRVRVEHGPLSGGCLGRLDAIATRFDLRIVEVAAAKQAYPLGMDADAVPTSLDSKPHLAAGSVPLTPAELEVVVAEFDDVPTATGGATLVPVALAAPADDDGAPLQLAATPEAALATAANESTTRVVVGPVRSGVILDHEGSLFIFGDVNPGAEVRATGNIVVLGRLRGTAHAGIGQEQLGFILALRLEPQQLRIARKVARSGEDMQAIEPEIAFITDDKIVVERYLGKLPRNLASSI